MESSAPGFAIFASMVECAMTNAQSAYEYATNLSFFKCEARDIARQRRMNQMVENQIIQIEEIFNIVVAVERAEERNHVPFPPHIIRDITFRNYRNGIGRTDGSRPADAAEVKEWESPTDKFKS